MGSTYTVANSKHATLSTGSADLVKFSTAYTEIEVVNRSTHTLWVRTGGTLATTGGDNTIYLGPNQVITRNVTSTAVSIIANPTTANVAYSVHKLY